MIFKNITILDENYVSREDMYIGIKDEIIDYIGTDEPLIDYGEQYDGRGKLLMTGFVNSHAHSPMTLMRGYGENLVLQDWLNKKIFPFEAKLDRNAVYWGTMLAMAESLKFGIVSTTDMYYFCQDIAKAVIESGAKSNISRSIVNISGQDLWLMTSSEEMMALYNNFNNIANGRIKVDMSLHAEYTSDSNTVKQLAEYTKKIGANMHVHVSETKLEHEECKQRHGMTPVQYLNNGGLFDTNTTAAHCVWIEGEDFDILKEKGVTVASNPISNLKLASGVCNIPKLLKMGINVAIGTDSVASNNSLNFIEEMKVFAIASKGQYGDPTAVTPEQTLKAATLGGFRAQGRDDCGVMSKGYKADLVVLDLNVAHMHPTHNLLNNVVYSADGSDVLLTMVDGKILYEKGEYKTIDIEKTIFEVERATDKILTRI